MTRPSLRRRQARPIRIRARRRKRSARRRSPVPRTTVQSWRGRVARDPRRDRLRAARPPANARDSPQAAHTKWSSCPRYPSIPRSRAARRRSAPATSVATRSRQLWLHTCSAPRQRPYEAAAVWTTAERFAHASSCATPTPSAARSALPARRSDWSSARRRFRARAVQLSMPSASATSRRMPPPGRRRRRSRPSPGRRRPQPVRRVPATT